MKSKLQISLKSLNGMSCMIAAVLALAALIGFIIYGAVYSVYFDLAVVIFLILGCAGYAMYVLLDGMIPGLVVDLLPLIAVICVCAGMNIMILNSYEVWGDWYGNFNMYGSQGGIAPVITLAVLDLLAIIAGIVTCFSRRKGAK